MVNRVVHFEINADQPEKLVDFYHKAFGWKIVKWEGPVDYWLIETGEKGSDGIDGAIKHRSENLSTVNTIEVDSIEDSLGQIEKAGGKSLSPKMAIPGVGYHTYCADPEGTVFGLMQNDPKAS